MRRFVLSGGVKTKPYLLTAETTKEKAQAPAQMPKLQTRIGSLEASTPEKAGLKRRHVREQALKIMMQNAKKVEKAVKEVKKTASKPATVTLYERFKKEVLNLLKREYPALWKCHQYPMFCTLPRDLAPISEAMIKAVQSRLRKAYGLAGEIRKLAGEFKKAGTRDSENPAIIFSTMIMAEADTFADFFRTRPVDLNRHLDMTIAIGKYALGVLKRAIKLGAKHWSKSNCTSSMDKCLTASEPVKVKSGDYEYCVQFYVQDYGGRKKYEEKLTEILGHEPVWVMGSTVSAVYMKNCNK